MGDAVIPLITGPRHAASVSLPPLHQVLSGARWGAHPSLKLVSLPSRDIPSRFGCFYYFVCVCVRVRVGVSEADSAAASASVGCARARAIDTSNEERARSASGVHVRTETAGRLRVAVHFSTTGRVLLLSVLWNFI